MRCDAHCLQRSDRRARLGADDVGQRDRAERRSSRDRTSTTVFPCAAKLARLRVDRGATIRRSPQIAGAHDLDAASPSTRRLGALAGEVAEVGDELVATPGPRVAPTMPRAIGCSECGSSAAAQRRAPRASLLLRRTATTSVTPNRPSVSVPVLSKTTAFTLRARSNAARSRISRPLAAARLVRHRDHQRHGETERVRAGDDHDGHRRAPARRRASRAERRATRRRSARRTPSAMIVSQSAARSARSCVRDLRLLRLPHQVDDLGQKRSRRRSAVTSTVIAPSPLTAPPMTAVAGRLLAPGSTRRSASTRRQAGRRLRRSRRRPAPSRPA